MLLRYRVSVDTQITILMMLFLSEYTLRSACRKASLVIRRRRSLVRNRSSDSFCPILLIFSFIAETMGRIPIASLFCSSVLFSSSIGSSASRFSLIMSDAADSSMVIHWIRLRFIPRTEVKSIGRSDAVNCSVSQLIRSDVLASVIRYSAISSACLLVFLSFRFPEM